MTYWADRYERNSIALADYEEDHSARRRLTEVERAIACGHGSWSLAGICHDCGEAIYL